ncbi:MAG: UDP-N-acetylmuramate dehydrogenase [Bacteroidia bacterium]|nr:UDP-N-acetylmuramate dehydrogenase [Bacteroidia bacterium]
MILLRENYPIRHLNTFGFDVKARYFFSYTKRSELLQIILASKYTGMNRLILGAGSNVLFTGDFNGLVIHPGIKGIQVIYEDADCVHVKAGGGENWDEFVRWTVDNNFSGIENLSLIPGTVGAAPVQNIGAYGMEVSNSIISTEVFDIDRKTRSITDNSECGFGYRESVFKSELKNRCIIESVIFRLEKKHRFVISYGNIKEELKNFPQVDLQTIRQSVINIRNSKLPDPVKLPNAGSFFKNPVVTVEFAKSLKMKYENLPVYPSTPGYVKLAAGWLIEQCGWKGKRTGHCGVHKNQALILVNYGGANGKDLLQLADKIMDSVFDTFGVRLEMEVNVI